MRRYLLLELAVVWRGWWSAPLPRRKRPIQPRRFYYLAVPVIMGELALAMQITGLVRPLGGF